MPDRSLCSAIRSRRASQSTEHPRVELVDAGVLGRNIAGGAKAAATELGGRCPSLLFTAGLDNHGGRVRPNDGEAVGM
jgi:hypothetical protein